MESILTSVKQLLGIEESTTDFDTEIILNINSVLMILNQLAVGPIAGFKIADKTATWLQFIGASTTLESVKTYVYLKVRLLFDPPQTGYLVESIKALCTELEWRICAQAESEVTV